MEEHEQQPIGSFRYADHQRKLAEIHRERDEIERQLLERCRQLEVYHSQQEEVRERRADRLLDNLRKERKMLLNQEAKRLNAKPEFQYTRENSGILENVLSERTKEFMKSQQEISQSRRSLHRERQRLQLARQKLKESRVFGGDLSPVPSPVSHVETNRPSLYNKSSVSYNPDMRSVRGMDSVIQESADAIPDSIKRCWTLREDLDAEYLRKHGRYSHELGPDSYPTWQKESYALVSPLVAEFVDEVLEERIPTDAREVKTLNESPYRSGKNAENQLAGEKTVSLLAEEVILEVTSELTSDVASEVHQLFGCVGNVVNKTLMAEAERVAMGHNEGRSRRDPNYSLVTKAYFLHQKDRDQTRPGLWVHTQQVYTKKVKEEVSKDKNVLKTNAEKEDEEEDLGVTLIQYDHILPIDVGLPLVAAVGDTDKWEQLAHQSYITKELQFWQDMDPYLYQTSLSKRCRGITCVQPSTDHSHLAIGTGHGDLLIFALWTEPWLLVRVAINTDKSPDRVLDISWSHDRTHLTSVNGQGGVQLWSMLPWGQPVEKSLLKTLGVSVLSESYLPYSLTLLLSLHHDDKDFRFQQGPLAERKVSPGDQFPTHAAFSTDLTLLGNQHSVCIALEKGDILKCDTEEATMISTNQRRDSSQSEPVLQSFATRFLSKPKSADSPSLIGKGLATELLRKHTSHLFLIGFVDNCGDMVTVDKRGYINLWDNSSEKSGADWLEPKQRFRLSLHKTMYTTTPDSPTEIIFSEKELKESRTSRQEIDKQRKIAEQTLKSLRLGDPWHIQSLPAQRLKTQIYLPNDLVTSSGAHFHLVMRRQPRNDLYTYFTRLYKPSQVKCSRFLGCVMNPAGTEIIFLLLFPETPPKAPHVSVIVLCVPRMRVRDIRLDIPLSQTDHDHLLTDNHVSFHVSRVHALLGADYLFLSLRGGLSVYSLLTGQTVLKLEDRNKPSEFGGCSINVTRWNQPVNSRLTVCSGIGKLLVINYAEKHSELTVLELTDGATEEASTAMKAAFRRWGRHSLPPPDQRLTDQGFSMTPPVHPEVFVRSLIMELVNRAVPGVDNTPKPSYIQRGYRAVVKKVLGKLQRNL